MGYESRIETLRAKLRAKLEAQRANRPDNQSTASATISKRAGRRAEKKRKIEQAKARNSNAGSTQVNNHDKGGRGGKNGDDDRFGGSKILALKNGVDTADNGDLSGIDYGGIAGLKDGIDANYTDSNKSLKNMGKKKSLEHLLHVAAKNKEKLERLKLSEDQDDKEKAKRIDWGDTLKAADGTRSNVSDPALLKKAIKRKAKKKAKSQQGWKTRMVGVKTKMDERQKIRQHNIGQRKLGGAKGANLSSKRIDDGNDDGRDDAGKRPRLGPHSGNTDTARPGFEGKKQQFINKGGKKSAKA